MTPDDISVVIPTLNEQQAVAGAVESARRAGAGEVVVVDGGSQDATVQVATEAGATKLVHALPGRGTQLNSGAAVCDRPWMLFLHADNTLDPDCLHQICRQDADWGAFRQRIDSPQKIYRAIEWGNAWRVKVRAMPFGDQAIFVRAALFRQIGGFPEIPLMEDVALSRRLRRHGRPALLPGPIAVSPRRWQRRGVVRQTVRNWTFQIAYACGVSPETLSRRYR